MVKCQPPTWKSKSAWTSLELFGDFIGILCDVYQKLNLKIRSQFNEYRQRDFTQLVCKLMFASIRLIFTQICKMSPTLKACQFLCVCASACYHRSHRSYLSEKKNFKMTFVDFDICHEMASLRKFYAVTLTYFSNVNNVLKIHHLNLLAHSKDHGRSQFDCEQIEN